jgi:hypothetical protein
MFAGLFLFQAFFNMGCCGSQGCAVPYSSGKSQVRKTEEAESIKE